MRSVTVLIVEDEPLTAMHLAFMLTTLDYGVVGIAASGEEAVEAFRRTRPAAVLMDIGLGSDGDGIGVAQIIRRESNACIIFLTSCADTETVRRAREVDPDGYLVKPAERRDLDIALGIGLDRREAFGEIEAQLRQSQKMDALGRLASGVSHDFANILTVIKGCSELLLRSLDGADLRRDLLIEIQDAGERAASLTRQLLSYSRSQPVTRRVLDLNDVVRGMEQMLRRLIGENIALIVDLGAEDRYVYAAVGQMEQVLLNLAVNARDAMPNGGVLRIETANVDREHGSPSGALVRLRVADTGCGMDADTKARIFEPFFSTKESGKGTGLGLSTVQGIVKRVEGGIEVESRPGAGTCFNVYFPAAAARLERDRPAVHPVCGPSRGASSGLLVEDGERALCRVAELERSAA